MAVVRATHGHRHRERRGLTRRAARGDRPARRIRSDLAGCLRGYRCSPDRRRRAGGVSGRDRFGAEIPERIGQTCCSRDRRLSLRLHELRDRRHRRPPDGGVLRAGARRLRRRAGPSAPTCSSAGASMVERNRRDRPSSRRRFNERGVGGPGIRRHSPLRHERGLRNGHPSRFLAARVERRPRPNAGPSGLPIRCPEIGHGDETRSRARLRRVHTVFGCGAHGDRAAPPSFTRRARELDSRSCHSLCLPTRISVA